MILIHHNNSDNTSVPPSSTLEFHHNKSDKPTPASNAQALPTIPISLAVLHMDVAFNSPQNQTQVRQYHPVLPTPVLNAQCCHKSQISPSPTPGPNVPIFPHNKYDDSHTGLRSDIPFQTYNFTTSSSIVPPVLIHLNVLLQSNGSPQQVQLHVVHPVLHLDVAFKRAGSPQVQ